MRDRFQATLVEGVPATVHFDYFPGQKEIRHPPDRAQEGRPERVEITSVILVTTEKLIFDATKDKITTEDTEHDILKYLNYAGLDRLEKQVWEYIEAQRQESNEPKIPTSFIL